MVTQVNEPCKEKLGGWVPVLLLLLATAFWGVSFTLVKSVVSDVGPFTFITWRCAVALPCFLVWQSRQQWKSIDLPSTLAGLVLGLLLYAMFALQTIGITMTTATNAALLTGTYVVLTPIFALVLIRERLRWGTVGGVLLAASGILVLTEGNITTMNRGDLLVLGGTIFIALQIIAVQVWTKRFNPYLMATHQILWLGLLSLASMMIWEDMAFIPRGWMFWFTVFTTGFFSTFLAFLIQATMQRKTTASVAALIYATEGVWGAFFAWLIGGELIGWGVVAGGGLLFAGILVAEYSQIRKAIPLRWVQWAGSIRRRKVDLH